MSQTELFDILSGENPASTSRFYGVVTGKVTENKDPQEMGRVKVRFPWLREGEEVSHWVRLSNRMAGKDFGTWNLPDIDDEVLIAFEHGDFRFPYLVGMLWSNPAPPPTVHDVACLECLADAGHAGAHSDEKNQDGENRFRAIKSKAGNLILFDDGEGKGRGGLSLVDGTGLHRIDIICEQKKIEIRSQDGDVNFHAPKGLVQFRAKEIVIEADEIVGMSAEQDANTYSGDFTKLLANGSLALRADTDMGFVAQTTGQIEALGGLFATTKGGLKAEAQAGMTTLQATGLVQVKGSTVTMDTPDGPSAKITGSEQTVNELLSDVLEAVNEVVAGLDQAQLNKLIDLLKTLPGVDAAALEAAKQLGEQLGRDLNAPGLLPGTTMLPGPDCPSCGVPAQFVCDNPHCRAEAGVAQPGAEGVQPGAEGVVQPGAEGVQPGAEGVVQPEGIARPEGLVKPVVQPEGIVRPEGVIQPEGIIKPAPDDLEHLK